MHSQMHTSWRAGLGTLLVLVTCGCAEIFAATDSKINLEATSLVVTDAQAPPGTPALTQVAQGRTVRISCRIQVRGTAYQQFKEKFVYWGASSWGLVATKTSAHLIFDAPLEVVLMVGKKTVATLPVQKVVLNPSPVIPAPDAPPNYIGHRFDNAGKPHVASATWALEEAGTHAVRCLVDAGHTVKETAEGDNQATVNVAVIGTLKLHEQPQAPAQASPPAAPKPRVPQSKPGRQP